MNACTVHTQKRYSSLYTLKHKEPYHIGLKARERD